MGFDFHFANRDSAEVPAPDMDLYETDEPAWRAAWERHFDADPTRSGHFGCSYSWGAKLAAALAQTGVLVHVESGPFPRDCWVEDAAGEPVLTEVGRAYLSRTAGKVFRVPDFKFSSSDGWIFSPDECRWMAYALRPYPDENIRAFGRFCDAAALHGGMTTD